MKKKGICLVLAAVFLLSLSISAFADHLEGGSGFRVTYTEDGKMETNFSTGSAFSDALTNLLPGDDVTLTITIVNSHSGANEWYMTNEVLHSLEDRSLDSNAHGGGYSYTLAYTAPDGTVNTLFSSENVGGETVSAAGEGLHEATSALKDYFYLDTLSQGETAVLRLNVALDGESQGNAYQGTEADLRMNFAVENLSTGSSRTSVVATGDDTDLSPFYLVMVVSGTLFLILAADGAKKRRREAGR